MSSIRVLIADDERLARTRLAALLAAHPSVEVVAECEDGSDALQEIATHRPDVALLDIRMVEVGGLDVARALQTEPRPLIVFATAYDGYAVDAFDVSAFDYLLKPIDEDRLARTISRAREQIRLLRTDVPLPTVLRSNGVEVDVVARSVTQNGQPCVLRPKEFDLLVAFLRRPDAVISRSDLLAEVWGYQSDVSSRTVDTHVSELRRKLGDLGRHERIESIARIGYRWASLPG